MNVDIKELFAKLRKKNVGIEVGDNPLIDLTPASYLEVISTRRYQRRWTYAFFILLAICLAVAGLFYGQSVAADLKLRAEQNNQQQLDIQIAEYSDVNDVLVAQERARGTLRSAAAAEINWSEAYQNIESAVPNDTTISRMAVNVNETPDALTSAAVQINLVAGSTMSYSDTLGVISDLEEVSSVTIGGLERAGDGQYTFSMSFTYDDSIRTGRFSDMAGE